MNGWYFDYISSGHAKLHYALLSARAFPPRHATVCSQGVDLAAPENIIIPPMSQILIDTGVQLQLPAGMYARIAPRSGLAKNHGLMTMAGVVDTDYRDGLCVLLFNSRSQPYHVNRGDFVAQVVLELSPIPVLEQCQAIRSNSDTHQGFGSTDFTTSYTPQAPIHPRTPAENIRFYSTPSYHDHPTSPPSVPHDQY